MPLSGEFLCVFHLFRVLCQLHNGTHDTPGIHLRKQQHQKQYHRPQHGQALHHHRADFVRVRRHHRQKGQNQAVILLFYGDIVKVSVVGIFYA